MLSNESGRTNLSPSEQAVQQDFKNVFSLPLIFLKILATLVSDVIGGVLNRNQRGNALTDRITDGLIKRGKRHKLGNFGRALKRSLSSKGVNKKGKLGRSAGKLGKLAKTGDKLSKAGKIARTANSLSKAGKVASAANNFGKAGKIYKAVKTANTARKLATIGKIAVTAGKLGSLTNPVGIAIFAGTIIAPIAVKQIAIRGQNKYQAKSREDGLEISQSEITPQLASQITKAKQTLPNEQSGISDLDITDQTGEVLLKTSETGKVLINRFSPRQELNFFQENTEGENQLIFTEESPLELDIFPKGDLPKQDMKFPGETLNSSELLKGLLKATGQNPEEKLLTTQMAETIDKSEVRATSGLTLQEALKQQNFGDAIFQFFQERNPGNQTTLNTEKYDISREGREYSVADKEGNLLLGFTKNVTGIDIQSFNLNPEQDRDFSILRDDLKTNQPLSGNFQLIDKDNSKSQINDLAGLSKEFILKNFELNQINSRDFSISDQRGNPLYFESNGEVLNDAWSPAKANIIKQTLLENKQEQKKAGQVKDKGLEIG